MAKKAEAKSKTQKQRRINKEKNKLIKLFEEIPENQKKLCEKLIDNAAYMAVTLEDLQQIVTEEGAVIKKKNGNGFIVTQEHPAQKTYTALVKTYATTVKQLSEILPEQQVDSKLMAFLNND